MSAPSALRSIGPIDLRSIGRDSLLLWMAVLAPLIGLLLRFAVPALDAWSRAEFDVAITPWSPLIASYFVVLQVPMIAGVVVGFLLLDERDEDTLTALLVTPLPLAGYLRYRIGLPAAAGFVLTLVAFALADLVEVGWLPLVAVTAVASLGAPLMALCLAAFAADKVQGFALMKGLGGVMLMPVAAWFLAPPWQYAAGILPSYWPIKAFWMAASGAPGWWIPLVLGALSHALAIGLLLARFQRVLHR